MRRCAAGKPAEEKGDAHSSVNQKGHRCSCCSAGEANKRCDLRKNGESERMVSRPLLQSESPRSSHTAR